VAQLVPHAALAFPFLLLAAFGLDVTVTGLLLARVAYFRRDHDAVLVVNSRSRSQQRAKAGPVVMPAQQQVHRVGPPRRRGHHHDDQRPGRAAAGTLGGRQRPGPANATVSRSVTQLATSSDVKPHAKRLTLPGQHRQGRRAASPKPNGPA
jgi:hypothetical protein